MHIENSPEGVRMYQVPTRGVITFILFFTFVCIGTIYGLFIDPVLNGWKWEYVLLTWLLSLPTSMGVTIFLHRYLTHQSFKAGKKTILLMGFWAGTAAQGFIDWSARHRRHHAHTDRAGDPHSPIVGYDGTPHSSTWNGFWYSHIGWLFDSRIVADAKFYCPDLLENKTILFLERNQVLWITSGFSIPVVIVGLPTLVGLDPLFGIGPWQALLWGGFIKLFYTYNVTWSVNSVCHLRGSRRFETREQSRDNVVVKILGLGEGDHNGHHKFPSWAWIYLFRGFPDISGICIWTMGKLRLAWGIKSPNVEKRESSLISSKQQFVVA